MKTRAFVLSALVLCAMPVSVHASTILNENFDELSAALGVSSVGAFHAIDGTNVDIVGPGNGFGALCASPESGNCVDLDGTGGNPQGILQTVNSITLMPGVNYLLSFDLVGSGRGVATSTSVAFGPYSHTFVLSSGDVSSGIVTNQLVTVSTTTVANLTFTSNTPGEAGPLLDNVLITTAAASLPEPSGAILLGSGLMICLALARKRKAPARS